MLVLNTFKTEEKMKVCSILIFASYIIYVFLFAFFNLNENESKIVPILSSISLLLSAIAAALSESAIVGYLGTCFQPEQIEDFGTGTSFATLCDVFAVFITNNFSFS
jgi:hypothetical protein